MKMNLSKRTIYSKTSYPYYIFTSDIHGNINTLLLINQAMQDFPKAQLVGGGDYIDGRKHAKEVCDFLMQQASNGAIILNGNHEEMMLNFADGHDIYELGYEPLWYANGGKKTMRSFLGRGYAKPKTAKMLQHTVYYNFFKDRPIMYVTPYIIFVHGGIKPIADFDNEQRYTDVRGNNEELNLTNYDFYRLWSRESYCNTLNLAKDQTKLPEKPQGFTIENGKIYLKQFAHNQTKHVIVTGHTPTTYVKGVFDDGRIMNEVPQSNCIIRVVQYSQEPARIFTDGGCHSQLPHNYGNVTVLDQYGNIVKVYDYKHQSGIEWQDYIVENKHKRIFGK